ncbi:unnamed protein product [Mycena citricolor]|uniref:Uncharacterized protein n=1 Tax=Mycena citricolor TaxID=2018698 RepID=A0AAD2GWN8_9AGAR|nr:unnamed protein product [Mycena citricolor]CAK5281223.1 unnamed protein product [Mycena citricolor]
MWTLPGLRPVSSHTEHGGSGQALIVGSEMRGDRCVAREERRIAARRVFVGSWKADWTPVMTRCRHEEAAPWVEMSCLWVYRGPCAGGCYRRSIVGSRVAVPPS